MAYSASPIASLVAGLGLDGGTSSSIDTSGADILFLVVTSRNPNRVAITDISDSKSNAWAAAGAWGSGADCFADLYYCVAPSVGSGHTFTVSKTGGEVGVAVAAFSGAKQTSPLDQENGDDFNAGTPFTPGSVTPTEDNEIVLSFFAGLQADATSIDGGFSIVGDVASGSNQTAVGLAYLVQTTAAAANPSWTISGGFKFCQGGNSTFKAAAGATTTRGAPFGARGTAFNGGRTFMGILR